MKKNFHHLLWALAIGFSQMAMGQIRVTPVGVTTSLGFNTNGGIAEITAYDAITKTLFCVNGALNNVAYFDFSNPQSATPLQPLGTFSITGAGSINSIACSNGILAVVYENATDRTQDGSLQLFTTTGIQPIGTPVTVGKQPDMVTFSPNGQKVLVANEGEPNDSYTVDPEGSVTIVDVTNPLSPVRQQVSFNSLNGSIPHLSTQPAVMPSIRIFGMKNSLESTAAGFAANNVKTPSTVEEDLEPEYITVSADGSTAWVTCQENNAVVIIDVNAASVTTVVGLGYKNHALAGNGLDISRTPTNTNAVSIGTQPLRGMYQPDGISVININGTNYLLTANEGDARAYAGFNEELDLVAGTGNRFNPANYTASQIAAITAAGLRVSSVMGNTDGGNAFFQSSLTGAGINLGNNFEELYTFGARSFSIWNGSTGALVWDSGDQLERNTLARFPQNFNADHNGNSGNNVRRRSTSKGPEPEAVVTATLGDSVFAFIGLERIGGVMVYNITNPNAPVYRDYINVRNFGVLPTAANAATVGDLGPEGLLFIPASASPDGKNYLVVSNEVSGTIRILEVAYAKNIVKSAPSVLFNPQAAPSIIVLEGSNLEQPNVNISAPSGFEISTNSTSGFTTSLPIPTSGSLTNQMIYVRYTGSTSQTVGLITIAGVNISYATLSLTGINLGTTTGSAAYTLQLLHASDFEAGLAALDNAPRFVAIWNQFNSEYTNTLRVSGGDNFLPSPFFNAAADELLRNTVRNLHNAYLGGTTGAAYREGIGRGDMTLMNLLRLHASAIGNHEFDAGTGTFSEMISVGYNNATNPTEVRWPGTLFPYLSSNLDFNNEPNLRDLYTSEIRPTSSYATVPSINFSLNQRRKIAPATIANIGGENIGIVGATTQIVSRISSTGLVSVLGTNVDNMPLLASQIQPQVDRLRAQGINKIVLLSHLQQITNEKALAPLLSGVDIIVAAGSHTLMADNDDILEGDTKADDYPYVANDKDGNKTLIVCTAAEYSYVGRLVVDFDADGKVLLSSLTTSINGAWKASDAGMVRAGVNTTTAFTGTVTSNLAKGLVEGILTPNGITLPTVTASSFGIRGIINAQDGNIFGKTAVYLDGRREKVRLQETNLGSLSADANLWYARSVTGLDIQVSIKNGGGIRASIGVISAVGSDFVELPPLGNPGANKNPGEISQLDIANSLRFNNGLSVVTVTATQLLQVINHAIAGSGPNLTPGQFGQVGGVRYSYDLSRPAGSRIRNAAIINENGLVTDVLAVNGSVTGIASRTFGVVTLNFMVTGGDSYPFPSFNSANSALFNRRDVYTSGTPGFAVTGYEQDAFAQYMRSRYPVTGTGFNFAETIESQDLRIQNVGVRSDVVLPTLGATVTNTISGNFNTLVTTNLSVAGSGFGVPLSIAVPSGVSVNGMNMATVPGNGGVLTLSVLVPSSTLTSAVLTVSGANLTTAVPITIIGSVVTSQQDSEMENGLIVYPNPVVDGSLNFNMVATGTVWNSQGSPVQVFYQTDRINTSSLSPGVYTIKFEKGATKKIVVLDK